MRFSRSSLYLLSTLFFLTLFSQGYAKIGPFPEASKDLLTRERRDTYDLYERNRDRANWDVRDNWRYQKRSFLRGNTRIDPNNFRQRRIYTRDRYSPSPHSEPSPYLPR